MKRKLLFCKISARIWCWQSKRSFFRKKDQPIAISYRASSKLEAIIKYDGSIVVCNDKPTDQIHQVSLSALPFRLRLKIKSLIDGRLSSGNRQHDLAYYYRLKRRLYAITLKPVESKWIFRNAPGYWRWRSFPILLFCWFVRLMKPIWQDGNWNRSLPAERSVFCRNCREIKSELSHRMLSSHIAWRLLIPSRLECCPAWSVSPALDNRNLLQKMRHTSQPRH